MKGKWINLDDNLMAYGLKRTYFSLENRKDDVLFSGLYSVGCIAEDGNHWNLRGADGLPYGPVTTIRYSGTSIWFGTDRGAIKKDKGWHYYNGKRWLPDKKVTDILPIDEHTVWIPDSLNHANNWWYKRGINSLQILSFLKAAYHVTNDKKFDTAYQDLIQKHHYAENTIQQKMYGPFDINHSDDELAFLPYYILFRYANEPELLPIYTKSIQRSWKIEQQDRIPIWNIIASTALKKDCDLPVALEELQLIPLDLITWSTENSHRWDLPPDPLNDRFGREQSLRPIPAPECGISKWNSNTYQYNTDSNGSGEDDGAYFLLPYWMGRYHGFLIEK